MEFSVQATLGYRVLQETPFVFNVQAQAFITQVPWASGGMKRPLGSAWGSS
jgi:hypothetical protein